MTQNMQAAFGKLDAYARKKMHAEGLQGMTVAVTDRNRTLWQRTYGYSNAEKKEPVGKDTLFQIGSISKSFAGIALLQLVQEGKVDLDRPVTRYLPWLEIKSKHKPVTLHHLLTHTGGIPLGYDRTPEAVAEIVGLRDVGVTARPGELFHYSNIGYKIVGAVVAELRGKSFSRALYETVIRPLEMKATSTEITHDLRHKQAVGYWPLYDDRPMKKRPEWAPCTWIESDAADGSICTTATDMCAYVRMLLNRGKIPGGRLISERSYAMLVRKAVNSGERGKVEHYGYGLALEPYHGHTLIGHTGGMLGFISSMRLDPAEGVGAFASTNCMRSVDDVTRLAVELVRRSHRHEGFSGAETYALPPRPNLDDFTGTYTSASHFLEVRKKGGQLMLRFGNEEVPLEWRERDCFFADHPSLDRHLFVFGRSKGKVVDVTHGQLWYTNGRYRGKRKFPHPKEWEGMIGHYRSNYPWLSNVRVALVRGTLEVSRPGSPPEPLVPIGNKSFRVGADRRSPERMTFSSFVDGKAQIVCLSGCELARTFTP